MRPFFLAVFAAVTLAGANLPAFAQRVSVSEGAADVSVAIYRDPTRMASHPIRLNWLNGYALITEKRVITIPAGRGVIRFEGVASGMLPESAIVTGMPVGVREKNLDADLLSPYSLYARSYGRPVTIRRTIGGNEREERAIIRSGPDGAAIFETADGFFAADCQRSTESILFDSVPDGLSAKPTLSIETDSPREMQATISLSYLAWGFDWQANYVATMRPDGEGADLIAWVTLANGDVTSFDGASVMVVAGKPNVENPQRPQSRQTEELSFECLSSPPEPEPFFDAEPRPMVEMSPMMAAPAMRQYAPVVVTGARVTQEDLGDLKLYRVPHRTALGSKNQKQVALLDRPAIPVVVLYRTQIFRRSGVRRDVEIIVRANNKKNRGLGLPLPQGSVAVFAPSDATPILVGEGQISDKAIGEEVEIPIGRTTQVSVAITSVSRSPEPEVFELFGIDANTSAWKGPEWEVFELRVHNTNPHPIRYEAELAVDDAYKVERPSAKLVRRKGRDVWITTIAANDSAKLRYQVAAQ